MKKTVIAILLSSALVWNSDAQQPITLTRADFPKPTSGSPLPDSVEYIALNRPAATVTTISGANQSWSVNFTGTNRFQSFVPMSATPVVFQIAFLSCDFAQPLANGMGSNGFGGGLNATDMYEYFNYNSGNTRLESKGFGANITMPGSTTALPLAAVFSSPDVIYRFPLNYGDIDSSTSGFDVSIPGTPIGTVRVKRSQKRVNHVDGWGLITLPSGTFDVLRVVSNIDRVDSFITGTFAYGTPSKPAEYKWIANGKKIPVLQINGNVNQSGVFSSTNGTMWTTQPNGIDDYTTMASDFSTFPNPFAEQLSVSFSLAKRSEVAVTIENSLGQQVAVFYFEKEAGEHTELLPLSLLAAGEYIVQCNAGNNTIAKKLIKR